jgi:protease-4
MSEQIPEPARRVEPQLTAAQAAAQGGATPGHDAAATGRTSAASSPPGWERDVLEKLVMGTLLEQRRARRWRIFFRLAGLALIGLFFAMALGWIKPRDAQVAGGRHTAVIELNGVIESGGQVNSETVNASLRAAYKDSATAGVVLRINSPGGSPVQAGMISDEIRRLRAKHPDVPLYAVVEEICASGGYYIAAATDRIFVDKASLVGSIGVLIDGFGFTEAMDKVGVERRLLTAGANKGFLDPFSPLTEEQRVHAMKMLDVIHAQFIETVRKGREGRLKETPDLFSGLVWTGSVSVDMGLADAIGSVESVARDVIKAEELVDFTRRENLAERLAKRIGASAGQAIARHLGMASDGVRLR